MAFNFTLPLRVIQAIFALIVLALTAWVASVFHDAFYYHYDSPSQNNFLIFTSIWTFLALAYLLLAPMVMPSLAHKFAVLGVEVLTMLFWFAGFIALAVYISDTIFDYCTGGFCSGLKAACVFAAFEWLLFTATTILSALHVFRSRGASSKPAAEVNVQSGV
ncbi:MAG: hypothetical protein M1836_002921 [Candelina mexicana]|nr:MAG: hypothetical protein M1836_002921 [Candelina mexicana]